MTPELEDYILGHIDPEPELLHEVYRRTYLNHLYPRMCSGHLQGRILKMLTRMIAPRRILELGTFTGYSALSIAEGMPDGAELHTVEIDDELEDELLALFGGAPRGADIILHIGDAREWISRLEGNWDMVYMDANKREYTEYFEAVLPLVKPGGYILADNTLWGGKVAESPVPTDPQSRGIMAFNDLVASDPRVETVILPLRDGLTILRKV